MYQLISDGGCDFSKDEAMKYNIGIVPFYICMNDETYLKEGIDISKDDYFQQLASEKSFFPKTAQPNPQDYIDAYTPHLEKGKDVLVLTISSKLSGSHNSAELAADILKDDFPDRTIIVIDSLSASVGQGLILGEMIKMRNAGYSMRQTKELVKEIISTTKVYFTLDSLEYLKRGGRIGSATALVGGILGLRPILQLEDGQVSQLNRVRGKKNAHKIIRETIADALKDNLECINIRIGHVLSESDAVDFKSGTEATFETQITNPITEIGAAIGTHAGPGALGFAICRKFDAISKVAA